PVDYVSTGLYYHNVHRANHSAPLIVWNAAQAAIAAEIASSCVFAHNMTVGGGGYGQNLAAYGATGNVAALSPSSMLAKSITDQWYYGEVNSFLPSYYGQPTPDMSNFEAWGHFTQVVWKGSLSVGCASQLCPAGTIFPAPYQSWFTVCNYVPPGKFPFPSPLNFFPHLREENC
ncbi:PR-1-like protein, partial [Hyaloscypha hepaticicola]